MELTRNVEETVRARAARDAGFRAALLQEGVACFLAGDVETGKTVLRDYVNATIGFEELGTATKRLPKSLMRMFGPSGNPQAKNPFEVVACLQRREGVRLEVRSARR